MSGSLVNTFRYKGWMLGVNLAYSLGAKCRLFRVYANSFSNGTGGIEDIRPEANMNKVLINRWQKPGDELYTDIPSIMGSSSPGYSNYSRHYTSGSSYDGAKIADTSWDMYDYGHHRVVSANYLKCQNLSLTYEFRTTQLEKIGLQRLAITASGSNLFTLCSKKLDGQTPTQGGFSEVQLSDRPTYTLGLNVSF